MTTIRARRLPIEDYDDLRVTEIMPLLAGLSDEDLVRLRRHECDRKARISVLDRIDALRTRRRIPMPRISREDYPIHDPRTWQVLLDPESAPPSGSSMATKGGLGRLAALVHVPRRRH